MEMNFNSVRILIHNTINSKLHKQAKDIKDVNSRVADVDNKVNNNTQANIGLSTKVAILETKVKKVTDLIVTNGYGTKYLSNDGTYKTLVVEEGGDAPENIALIVTQNQEAIKTLNGSGVGSVEYKIKEAFNVKEIY